MKELMFENNKQEKDLNFDNIIQNTEIILADEELLEKAQKIIAWEYSQYMLPEERDEQIAFDDLCDDNLYESSETYVAQYTDPITKESEILGSVRLVFGDENRIPPLEAMELIDVINKESGENDWPQNELEGEVQISDICEIGRFVLTGAARKDPKTQLFVSSALMQAISNSAREKNAKLMIAIMPQHVYQFTARNGISLRQLNGDRKIIFSESKKAEEIRKRYPIYWYKLSPSLYRFDF